LAAVAMIVLGGGAFALWSASWSAYLLPLAAFLGGLAATIVVFKVANSGGRVAVATMLLAGIAVAAISTAGIGIFIFIADDDQLRTLNFWLLGSLAGSTWEIVLPALPLLLLPVVVLPFLSRGLNLLALGEQEAGHLGLDVEIFKRLLIMLVAVATGAAVAISGIIGFVGLVVPHILRLSIGPDHRFLLPGAALLGATLLLVADIISRVVVAPAELPIGILTSMIGGPFFLWLLIRQRRHLGL
ncbi:MAG: iron chelate uptake ABC transporter family permease subunit, partial [Pseudomonadota bacterium]